MWDINKKVFKKIYIYTRCKTQCKFPYVVNSVLMRLSWIRMTIWVMGGLHINYALFIREKLFNKEVTLGIFRHFPRGRE